MKLKIKDFIPFFIALICSIVVLPIYICTTEKLMTQKILQAVGLIFIPLIIPLLSLIFKKRLSLTLNAVLTLFSISTILFGGTLSFYERFFYYDKVAHTIFGVVGAFIVLIFLKYVKVDNLHGLAQFLIVLTSVLGMAAIWEIYEYVYTVLTGVDLQGWLPNLDQVGNMTVSEFFETYRPMWDTIWDIIVALFGVCIFYIGYGIDHLTGAKIKTFVDKEIEQE